ncbi:hypothetical protein [Nocardia arthritidis]|uniref:Uncharacterized protein n=1 Tax=Nocardia arthritidis TaxID=228602 RepID=A0A6G9Y525_9NOCA|nr:hypothetical protein [Nocardia arthritidis]QIS08187.1 hypothetical protein F5544_01310 [Nocardia arthritidis]
MNVSEPAPDQSGAAQPGASPPWLDALGKLGVDWLAVLVAGVIALLAVLDWLPKVPW